MSAIRVWTDVPEVGGPAVWRSAVVMIRGQVTGEDSSGS